jgi:hypothetical protein
VLKKEKSPVKEFGINEAVFYGYDPKRLGISPK